MGFVVRDLEAGAEIIVHNMQGGTSAELLLGLKLDSTRIDSDATERFRCAENGAEERHGSRPARRRSQCPGWIPVDVVAFERPEGSEFDRCKRSFVGQEVEAVFGFCSIRNFGDATEVLKEKAGAEFSDPSPPLSPYTLTR